MTRQITNTTTLDTAVTAALDAVRNLAAIANASADARYLESDEAVSIDTITGDELEALQRAAKARSDAETAVAAAVAAARANGHAWSTIGAAIGTTGQAANQRYG